MYNMHTKFAHVNLWHKNANFDDLIKKKSSLEVLWRLETVLLILAQLKISFSKIPF